MQDSLAPKGKPAPLERPTAGWYADRGRVTSSRTSCTSSKQGRPVDRDQNDRLVSIGFFLLNESPYDGQLAPGGWPG